MDSLAQLLALIHKVHHKLDHIGDPVRKLCGRGIYNRFILRTVVHLLTEIGVFDLGDVSFPTENALSFIHQGSQLILKTECFFQIHCVHSFASLHGYIIAPADRFVIEPLV